MARTGYETTAPTRGGNLAVVLTIDKTGFYKGAKETGKALSSMQRKVNSEIKNLGYSKNVKVKMTMGDNMFFHQTIVKTLENAVDDITKIWGKKLASDGKMFFKEIIRTAPNRVKAQPGRIETGLMMRSVQGRTYHTKNTSHIGIGWNITDGSTYYRYFSFQEDGSRRGASPMRAVPQTARFISERFQTGMAKDLKLRLDSIK